MIDHSLERPPLEPLRIMADGLRSASEVEIVSRREDIIEMLECSADYLQLQACALAGAQSGNVKGSIARPEPLPPVPLKSRLRRIRSAWTDAYTYFAAGAFAGAMLVGLFAR